MKYRRPIPKRKPIKLKVGKKYNIFWAVDSIKTCVFIQPTEHGFNFLDIETNKCVLKQHVYPSRAENHKSGDWFWFNENLTIQEHETVLDKR